jgi:hypothetical protein
LEKTRPTVVSVAALLKKFKELLIVVANTGKCGFRPVGYESVIFGATLHGSVILRRVLIGRIPGFRHGLPVSSLPAA